MSLSLPDWSTLADTDDAQWPLLAAVLRVAADEYPGLDAQACAAQLQAHADSLATEVASISSLPLKMAAINRYLFQEQGYGPADDYYAADNNHLQQVLARRRGNPIALAIVQMEVARRLGLAVHGIAFPGHFLTALDLGEEALLAMDPYHGGHPLGLEQIEKLAAQHLGGQALEAELLVRLLMPTPVRGIVLRLLRNLQRSWDLQGQWDKVARCADRQLLLAPDNTAALRDRGLAYMQLGHLAAARHDLDTYLQREPQAPDSEKISQLLRNAPVFSGRMH